MKNYIAIVISFILGGVLAYSMAMRDVAKIAITDKSPIHYNGAPIEPACIVAVTMDAPQDLTVCGKKQEDGIRIQGDDALHIEDDGAIGRHYECEAGTGGEEFFYCGFQYYRHLGNTDEGMVIHSFTSGGGSGVFDMLGVYRRDGNILSMVREIPGGDRCHNGIANAGVTENGQIYFERNITAAALVDQFADVLPFPAPALRNAVPDCMACCFATLNMTGDTLTGMTLSAQESFMAPSDNRPDEAKCFFDVYAKAKSETPEMDAAQAMAFIRHLRETCQTPVEPGNH